MRLILKPFQSYCCPRTKSLIRDAGYANAGILRAAFCTSTPALQDDESMQKTESPELPNWVKTEKPDDDDFVLPSLSHWIENHKFAGKKLDRESLDTDVDKISKILKNQFESQDAVVEALSGLQVEVTESLMEQILKRFSFDWIQAVGSFKWAKSQTGFKSSPDLYNLMVDTLGKARKFDLMWDFVEEMRQLEGYITLNTMGKVIRRLSKAGKHDDAVGVFRSLERYGVQKDIYGLNLLMDSLIKERGIERAENVYNEFKHELPPDRHTFNILVHGWCKIRRLDKANEYVKEMQQYGLNPDSVTYTCFIETYCNEKDFRKVDSTLNEMQRKGLRPTVVTYTIMMKAFGKAKEMNRSLDVYEKMKQSGCIPDNSFYSAMIINLSKSGRLKDAQEVFEDMAQQGVIPNVITYNSMIAAYAEDSKEEDALLLLKKMEENQCKPDLSTYAPLLKMCCRLGRMKVLSFLLNHMFKNNLCLDLGTYELLVGRLSTNGSAERACSFFEEAVNRGFLPSITSYRKLVDVLQKKGMDKERNWTEELMQKAKMKESVDSPRSSSQAVE